MLVAFISYWLLSNYSDSAAATLAVANACILLGFTLAESLGQSSALIVAQCVGSKNKELISNSYVASVISSGVLGLFLSLAYYFGSNAIISLLGFDPHISGLSKHYLQIVGSGFVIYSVNYALIYILNANGKTKFTMINSLAINSCTLVVSGIIFYFRPSSDAAILQALAVNNLLVRIAGSILLFIICRITLDNFSLKITSINSLIKQLAKHFNIGISNLIEALSYHIHQIILLIIISHLGTVAIAARSYVISIVGILETPSLALAKGNQILIGQDLGASNRRKADSRLRSGVRITVLLSIVSFCLGFFPRKGWILLFTPSPETYNLGLNLLTIALGVAFIRGLTQTYCHALKALGDVRFCVVLSLAGMWCLTAPGAYYLTTSLSLGLNSIWILLGLEEMLRFIIFSKRWNHAVWKRANLVHQTR